MRLHLFSKYSRHQIINGIVVFAVLLMILILYSLWSYVLPVEFAPDEKMRIRVPLFIVNHGSLPLGNDPEVMSYIWGTSYAFSVYGSSLVAVPFMLVAKMLFGSMSSLYFAARFANNLMCVLALFYTYRLGRKVGLQFASALFAVIVLGLWPQYVFLASYFNSEVLEFLSTIMVVFYAYSAKTNNFDYKSCIKWGLAIGVLVLSYYYAYGAIIASIIYYYGYAIKYRKNNNNSKRASKERYILKPLAVFLSAFLVSGWFFVRNFILYNGDLFGMAISAETSELHALDAYKPSHRQTPKNLGYSILSLFNNDLVGVLPCSPWIVFTVKSFIGVFGYMSIHFSNKIYLIYLLFVFPVILFALILCLTKCVKNQTKLEFSCTVIVALTPVLLSIYYSFASDYQPQGRYIMAGFPLVALLLAFGWENVFNSVSEYFKNCTFIKVKRSIFSNLCDGSRNSRTKFHVNWFVCVCFAILIVLYLILSLHVFSTYIAPNMVDGIFAEVPWELRWHPSFS